MSDATALLLSFYVRKSEYDLVIQKLVDALKSHKKALEESDADTVTVFKFIKELADAVKLLQESHLFLAKHFQDHIRDAIEVKSPTLH